MRISPLHGGSDERTSLRRLQAARGLDLEALAHASNARHPASAAEVCEARKENG